MTSPEDDGFEEALRRALSDAASEVEPGDDGLEKIRTRIGDRPPRPWLLSVLVGFVDRVRNWTWRGHWAWQDSLPGLSALRERRSRRSNFPGWGIGWLRLVTVLAGVAILAGIALGVQPVRHAISQASSSLNGGGGSPNGGAGTEGKGTQASGDATPTVGVASSGSGPVGQTGTTVATNSHTGTPHPAASGRCGSSALPSPADAQSSEASATAATSASADGAATDSAAPAAVSDGSATSAQPVYTSTNEQTCPVPRPTRTPTPTPTSSSAAPISTPSDSSPTQAPSPTWTDPTPTSSGSSPTSDPSSPRPSDPPSRSWQDRGPRRHDNFRDQHSRRR